MRKSDVIANLIPFMALSTPDPIFDMDTAPSIEEMLSIFDKRKENNKGDGLK